MFYKANQEHRFLQFVSSIPYLHIVDCYLGFHLKFIKLKLPKNKTEKFKSRKPILN